MIVGSLVLILVAVTLLVLGLAGGSSGLLVGSIAASLLAAVALVVGARQAAALRTGTGPTSSGPEAGAAGFRSGAGVPSQGSRPRAGAPTGPAPARPASDPDPLVTDSDLVADDGPEPPADEPAAQRVTASDAARLARLAAEVLVVDGRPRYHLRDCAHLRGRVAETLPVGEALELGFTPCGRCEPDSALLAEAWHD